MPEQFFGGSFKNLIGRFRRNKLDENSGNITGSGQDYFYLTGLVREFISEPDAYLIKRKEEERIKVTNPDEYELMTKNSIIAYIIDRGKSAQGKPPVICYPFFPHLSLPIKPGEHVWILKEENNGRNLYYWISRKAGVKQNEDINYTHAERFIYIDDKLRTMNEDGDLFGQKNELEERDFVSFDTLSQTNSVVNINQISKDSIAYNEEFTYEPVPPLKRKCGDAVIQGSNNSHIHLTTEKFYSINTNTKDFTGQVIKNPPGRRIPFSPAIDLCVGRKYTELDSLRNATDDLESAGDLSIIKTKRESGFEDYEAYEINKIEELFENNPISNSSAFKPGLSLDLDATNCGSRLYLSNNSAIDTTFGSSFDVLSSHGGPSLATYATHNRMVADGTLRLTNRLGQSFMDMDPEGNVVIKSSINDGQQFLSLINNGVSRLQARDKIELAVSSDNDSVENSVNEPYILYSELRDLLEKIVRDLSVINALVKLLSDTSSSNPLMLPAAAPAGVVVTAINTALTSVVGTAADNVQNGPFIDPLTDGYTNALLQIGQENEIGLRGTIASTKIFGESND